LGQYSTNLIKIPLNTDLFLDKFAAKQTIKIRSFLPVHALIRSIFKQQYTAWFENIEMVQYIL
jgi:hypothetical protein